MTKLLEEAFAKAAEFPAEDQELFAKWMLEELASERRWQELFARSPDLLERMANEALEEFHRGETLPLSFDDDEE